MSRHKTRAWLDEATRVATLVLELRQLIADLQSAGVDKDLIDKIRVAKEALEREPSRLQQVLADLLQEISAVGSSESAQPARSGDFWR